MSPRLKHHLHELAYWLVLSLAGMFWFGVIVLAVHSLCTRS
jgi:hypothetical protein